MKKNPIVSILEVSSMMDKKYPDRSWDWVFKKVVEEVGELNDVVWGFCDDEALEGEVADVIISLVDLYFLHQGFTHMGEESVVIDAANNDFTEMAGNQMTYSTTVPDLVLTAAAENGLYFKYADPKHTIAMLVRNQGLLACALNQPERSEEQPLYYITRMITQAVAVLTEGGFYNCNVDFKQILLNAIETKRAKWMKKAGL